MAYLNNRNEYVVVNGTSEDDNIYNSTGADHATVYGSTGNDSIHNWGDDVFIDAGEGNDIVYNGEDADDATILTGAGNDTVENWGETMTIRPGAGSNLVRIYGAEYMEFTLDESDGLTKIGDEIDYDANVNRYVGVGAATLEVDDDIWDVSIWLNGADGKTYDGIKVLDADDVRGAAILAGNDYENSIYGGEGESSLWGGIGSENDTLSGGDGCNTYFYLYGNGNDVVTNANDDDVINLLNIGLEDINFADVSIGDNEIKLGFNDGGSIKVNGRADVVFKLNGIDAGFKADRSNKGWRFA
ncbi:MAG: hypothetical protein IJU71_06150 [Selenomonadaceae bacterium]|nr:hypothetical protein [Selenomonadaceae bacterium]